MPHHSQLQCVKVLREIFDGLAEHLDQRVEAQHVQRAQHRHGVLLVRVLREPVHQQEHRVRAQAPRAREVLGVRGVAPEVRHALVLEDQLLHLQVRLAQREDAHAAVLRAGVLVEELAQKLARTRALSLIEDQQDDDELPIDDQVNDRSAREQFAEKVARNKCLILKTIRDCNPKLEELIEKERYPSLIQEADGPLPFSAGACKGTARDMFFRVFYVVTLMFVLLLVYLVLLQQNF